MAVISIVVPVYYNALSLPDLLERLAALAAENASHEFQFIFVDDGSGDDSYAVLYKLASQDHRVQVIKLARNFGSNAAILAGMTYATGDCVGCIAADLQDPPETLAEMIRLWESGHKVVLAARRDRKGDPWFTRLLATVFNWLYQKLVFKEFSPQGIGFFLVDRQVSDMLVGCDEKNPHLIGLILWSGYRREFVEYDRVEREHGVSRWTLGKKLTYLVDSFAAFSYLPLRIASALGLLLAGLGALYALVTVAARILDLIEVPGWTALTVIVLLTSGTQLLVLGVIGEYLWRNFEATRRRPLFVVDSAINVNPSRSWRRESRSSPPVDPETWMRGFPEPFEARQSQQRRDRTQGL